MQTKPSTHRLHCQSSQAGLLLSLHMGDMQGAPRVAWAGAIPPRASRYSCSHISTPTHPQHLTGSFFTFSHIQAAGWLLLACSHADLGTHWLR